jgi:heat shock protein HslJ
VAVVALLVVALVARDPSSGDDLLGTWILDDASMALLSQGADVPPEVQATLTFDAAGGVGGSAGCNSFGGMYTVDGDELQISELAQTLIACEPPLDAIEQAYVAALGEVSGYQVSGDTLVLTGGAALSFARQQPLALVGTAWQLETVATGTDAVTSVVAPGTITFADDGTVSGSTGCNTFSGSYTVSGDALSFPPLATTRIGCPDDIAAQEFAVLAGLEATTAYAIDGPTLTLLGSGGELLLGYRA